MLARLAAVEGMLGMRSVEVVDPNGVPAIRRDRWPAWRFPSAYFQAVKPLNSESFANVIISRAAD